MPTLDTSLTPIEAHKSITNTIDYFAQPAHPRTLAFASWLSKSRVLSVLLPLSDAIKFLKEKDTIIVADAYSMFADEVYNDIFDKR